MHKISYAYPSSQNAGKAGLKSGGWCLEVGGKLTGHASYSVAVAAIPAGSKPDRWSADHPANARFLNA